MGAVTDGPFPPPDEVTDPDAPGWSRPAPGPDERRADVLLAVALCIGALLSMVLYRVAGLYDDPAAGWVSVLCLAVVTLPLALRRRAPSAVACVVAAAFVVGALLHVPELLVSNIALFCALYTVGAWEPSRRRAAWVRGGIVVAMFVWLLVVIFQAVTDPEAAPDLDRAGLFSPLVAYLLVQLLTNVLYFAGAWWFGNHARAAARERARTLWRGRQLVAERRRVEEQAVALERLRLARELHDAVAHHVSLMGVQAAAARTLLAVGDTQRVPAALEQVEDLSREAVHELEGLLVTLRESAHAPAAGGTPDDASADGAAAPGQAPVGSLTVERLPVLVEQVRAAGMRVSYQVVGEPSRLPPLVSLNLYRIAQEALTNTRKHAGPRAGADVRLRYLDGAVELEVSDDGSGGRRSRAGRLPSTGLGLVGMRERVAADGGTLLAEPRTRGGFVVRARVPLQADATPVTRPTAVPQPPAPPLRARVGTPPTDAPRTEARDA